MKLAYIAARVREILFLQIDEKDNEEKLSRVVELFGSGKELPIVRPKPKPATKPRPARIARSSDTDAPTDVSSGIMVSFNPMHTF